MSNLHFVMRNLKGTSPGTKSHAYLSLIRPLLEYCSSVWDPQQEGLKKLIDGIQNKAARYVTSSHQRWDSITNTPAVSVSQLVENLNWENLATRRARATLRNLTKSLKGCQAYQDVMTKIPKATYLARQDHRWKVGAPKYVSDVGRYSFLGRGIRAWNCLAKEEAAILILS